MNERPRGFSFFHTPAEEYQQVLYSVDRAGVMWFSPQPPLQGGLFPGHTLALSLTGTGLVRIGQRSFSVRVGELIWADWHEPDIRWGGGAELWELMWVKTDSTQMDLLAQALNVKRNPVFKLRKVDEAKAIYRRVFKIMRERPIAMDAMLHAAVSTLIGNLLVARQSDALMPRPDRPSGLTTVRFGAALNIMRAQYSRPWKVSDLAERAGLSVQQFFRRFRQATGLSPNNWLRRERVNHAKRQLVETSDRIGRIAEHVGYGDALHFSRDFKKLVGLSPREYRRHGQSRTI